MADLIGRIFSSEMTVAVMHLNHKIGEYGGFCIVNK